MPDGGVDGALDMSRRQWSLLSVFVILTAMRLFASTHAQYSPFLLPAVDAELVLGLTCTPWK